MEDHFELMIAITLALIIEEFETFIEELIKTVTLNFTTDGRK